MNLLVLNSGSSSIKFTVFAASEGASEPHPQLEGELSGMGTPTATLHLAQRGRPAQQRTVSSAGSTSGAIAAVLDAISEAHAGEIAAVGYRVVHPGPEIRDHARITPQLLDQLDRAADFAPLHDPEAVTLIRETMHRMPGPPHFACFDTIFHQTMPEEASTYPIPDRFRERGVRRFGFHGLSCESVVRQMDALGPVPARTVIAHLGSGCSVTALLNGVSVDTSMGLTPAGGIVMGTRPGDLDPGLLFYLLRQSPGPDSVALTEKMLNHEAGMVALSHLPNDMQAVREAAAQGDLSAVLALRIFTRSIRKALGAFSWLLGGLDALIFTGGIGEHDARTRAEVLSGTEVSIDPWLNCASGGSVRRISASESRTAVFVAPAQEDLVIALHVQRMLQPQA